MENRVYVSEIVPAGPDVTSERIISGSVETPFYRIVAPSTTPVVEYIPYTIRVRHYPHTREELDLTILSQLFDLPVDTVTKSEVGEDTIVSFFIGGEPLWINPNKWLQTSSEIQMTEGMVLLGTDPRLELMADGKTIIGHHHLDVWYGPRPIDISFDELEDVFRIPTGPLPLEIVRAFGFPHYLGNFYHSQPPFTKEHFFVALEAISVGDIPVLNLDTRIPTIASPTETELTEFAAIQRHRYLDAYLSVLDEYKAPYNTLDNIRLLDVSEDGRITLALDHHRIWNALGRRLRPWSLFRSATLGEKDAMDLRYSLSGLGFRSLYHRGVVTWEGPDVMIAAEMKQCVSPDVASGLISSRGLLGIRSSYQPPIPRPDDGVIVNNGFQYLVLRNRFIPVSGDNLQERWNRGELLSPWGQAYLVSEGLISHAPLRGD